MIKEKELPKAVVSNKLVSHKATDLTIMSYDKNVHKLIIPTDLTQAEISDIIVLITFRYHKNIIQISGELVEDKIEIILPNEIRSLSGEFYIEININLTDNRQITFARYHARVVKSDIDGVDLDDAPEFYFELFDDIVQKVADNAQQAKDAIDVQTVGIEGHANASKQTMDSEANSVSDYGVSAKNTIDAKVDSVELAKVDALTAIDNKVVSVELAKQSALTSITQATSDVTDASIQFTVDLANTQSTIDAQVLQAQDSLQEVSDTLTAVNDKVATVNDTADSFVADVANKSQLVDDKYQQFDTSVTTAGQTIDDILGLTDDVQQVSAELEEYAKHEHSSLLGKYTFNGNTVVNVENLDVETGTFTAPNHGLANGMIVAITLNEDVLLQNKNSLPNPLQDGWRYVINATADTFQISSSKTGTPITYVSNPEIDYSKWHIEATLFAVTNIVIDNFKPSKNVVVRYKVKSHIEGANVFHVLPSRITTSVVNYISTTSGLLRARLGPNLLEYGHSQLLMWGKTQFNLNNNYLVIDADFYRANLSVPTNPLSTISTKKYNAGYWVNDNEVINYYIINDITSITMSLGGHMMLNGSTMEVYSLD